MIKKLLLWLNLLGATSILLYVFYFVKDPVIAPIIILWEFVSVTLLIEVYSNIRNIKKLSVIFWIFSTSFGIIEILSEVFFNLSELFQPFSLITVVTGILFIISTLFYIRTYNKIDVFIPIFILLSILAFVLKFMHLPGAGILFVISWVIPSILFLFIFYQRFDSYDSRTNRILGFFNKLISGTLVICFIGATFKIMHWPGAGLLLIISIPLFIISVLCVIFLLPSSNFIEWTKVHKRLFYRAILLPLLFMGIITSLNAVFPDTFKMVISNQPTLKDNPKNFVYPNYEIPFKEGLE